MEVKYCKFKFLDLKEDKKVKKVDFSKIPYFEVKVVKVKKEKKDFWCGGMNIDGKQYKVFKREKGVPYLEEFKKANIINGENIDKIQFPCFCSWNIPLDVDVNYGLLIKIAILQDDVYILYNMDKQHSYSLVVGRDNNLKELIKRWNIHILKGKIVIFQEEEVK